MLACKIRQSRDIKGFKFGASDKTIKISQYADDCMLFLNDINELQKAINILQDFGAVAGLMLNIDKCEGLHIGRNKALQNNTAPLGIKCPETLKYLGIYIGHGYYH